MTRKKIAFIKKGVFSHTNTSVGHLLVKYFPEYEVEFIDVGDLVNAHRGIVFKNYFDILRLYSWDLLTRKRVVWDCFYHTDYMFRKVKELVTDHLRKNASQYAFTFQTQSLYDGSIDGLPHFIYTDHTNLANLSYSGFGDARVFPKWNRLETTVYDRATKIFTMSNHVRRSLIEQYHCPPDKVSCVFAGCNIELKPMPPQNDDYRNKHILFVGVEWERKGGPLLLEAFQRVLKKHPDARLTIVGTSPEVHLPNVKVVGRVSLNEVRSHYPQASIFCLPTRLEPFGIVFIEAMLYKIPVVAPNMGALPDFIQNGQSGLLVTPNNVDALATALIDLLDHPERCRALGENGYTAVKDRYTWDAVGERLKESITASLNQHS